MNVLLNSLIKKKKIVGLEFIKPNPMLVNSPLITAHSGCSGTEDNSVEHIAAAINCGAEILEVDVRYKNGIFYLWHNRLKSMEEVEKCVKLEYVFQEIKKSGIRVNCDVKQRWLGEKVCKLAKDIGVFEQILFTGSMSPVEVRSMKRHGLTPAVYVGNKYYNPLGLSLKFYYRYMARKIKKLFAGVPEYGMNISHIMLDQKLYDVMTEKGVPLSIWTVNNEKRLQHAIGLRVHNITTRIPEAGIRMREEQAKEKA